MNLLLVEPAEVVDNRVTLRESDRRVHHLRTVLGVAAGSRIKAGVIGGNVGTAEVVSDGDGLVLALSLVSPPRAILPIELILAVPRPKVLTRVIEVAAAFGVARIDLTNAWRVDKSYLRSPRLDPASLAHAARLGAEQGATTHLPPIAVHPRLMPLLDERWPAPGSDLRLLAHPGAPSPGAAATRAPGAAATRAPGAAATRAPGAAATRAIESAYGGGPAVLAIGPEGGWIEREVETFVARGFTPVSLGSAILRVESAVAGALAQLDLLARLKAR